MRYTRHELKQDKFAETAAGAVHWTVEHRSKIIYGIIALGIVLVLAIGGWWWMGHREKQASAELGNALMLYNAPLRPENIPADPQMPSFTSATERSKVAKEAFAKVANSYGSTRSGQYAKYFTALTEADLGNTQAAEQGLKSAAETRNKEVAALAKFGLASLYRNTNRDADAIRLYKELSDNPTLAVPKTTAQLALAELYEQKQPDEARKMYEQIAKDNPKGPAGEIAGAKREAMSK